jgi:hypothetical protein
VNLPDAAARRSPADSRDLRPSGGAPTDAPVVAVRDVAIVPTGTDAAPVEEYRIHRPVTNFDLGNEVTIELLDGGDYDLMMAACRPRGHYYYAHPLWGQRYALVRRVDLAAYEANPYAWDTDERLSATLALSRLVRDTVHCSEFAGRIVDHSDGEQQVIPLYGFESRLAYRYGRGRDWLDEADAAELRDLLAAFIAVEPNWPARVRRGIRNCERASQTPYLSESQPRLVTGLEALFNTNPSNVSKQFRERVRALATELGIDGVSGRLLDRMYDFRSKAYHGDEIHLLTGDPEVQPEIAAQHRQLVVESALLQRVLRATVRKAIEDADFRELFAGGDRVRQRWPVAAPDDQGSESAASRARRVRVVLSLAAQRLWHRLRSLRESP